MNSLRSVSLLALASLSVLASAGTFTFSGTLDAAGPKFNRPRVGNPPSGLSSGAISCIYAQLVFSVDLDGTYTITGNGKFNDIPDNDGFGILYEGAFYPADAMTNVLVADDEGAGAGNYQIVRDLTAGKFYTLVSTTFGNDITGSFADVISGPGNILVNPVPEPTTMIVVGVGALAMFRRRRNA